MRRFFLPLALMLMTIGSAQAAALQQTAPTPLPSFVFEDAKGIQHSLSEYKGRILLLNIWASWCAPCVREMPDLAALQKKFDPDKFLVLPISEDRTPDLAENFYRAHALTFPILIDHAGRAPFVLHLRGLPTSLLINAEGKEIGRIEGGLRDDLTKITTQIESLMAR